MKELLKFTYQELKKGYANKDFLPSEVIKAYSHSTNAQDCLNVFITKTLELAQKESLESDKRVMSQTMRPLEGLPLGIKDIFCTKDVVTTAGSLILKNFKPFYSSTIVSQLMDAGALSLGKTNMDEFAMGSSTENSAFGPSINPLRSALAPEKSLCPGGSSGGSGACVTSSMTLASIGTDTGGSIRQPAAFCGIVGLKPTYGRCSRYGIIAFASSLDQAGPMARTVLDCADLFSSMTGHDPKDATSARLPAFSFTPTNARLKGLRVGIPKEYQNEHLNEEINGWWKKTAQFLKDQGAHLVDISLPHTHYGLPTYYIIAPAEASSNLARFDGIRYGMRAEGKSLDELYTNTRTQFLGEEVKRRILVGTYVLSAGAYEDFYLKSLQVRLIIRNEFKQAFKKVDVMLTPTTPSTAFAIGEKLSNPMEMYLSDMFTVGANLSGVPALSVPVGLSSSSNLPISMQLIADDFQEEILFNVGQALEDNAVGIKELIKGRVA